MMRGMRTDLSSGARRRTFEADEREEQWVLAHTALRSHPAPDPRMQDRGAVPLSERFPLRSPAMSVAAGPHFGCLGTVCSYASAGDSAGAGTVGVELLVRPAEPPFGTRISQAISEPYMPFGLAARVGGSPATRALRERTWGPAALGSAARRCLQRVRGEGGSAV